MIDDGRRVKERTLHESHFERACFYLFNFLFVSVSQPRYIRNMTPTWSVFGFCGFTSGTWEWSIEDVPTLDIVLDVWGSCWYMYLVFVFGFVIHLFVSGGPEGLLYDMYTQESE